MSLRTILWAIDDARCDDIPAGAFRVLLVLADHAHGDGTDARPYVGTIAERLRMSTRTVQRHLKALEAHGLIRRGDQRSVAHLDPRYRPVVWDLATSSPPVHNAVDNPVHRGDIPVTPADLGVTDPTPRGDSPGRLGVTPVVAHRNRPRNRPRTAQGGGRSASVDNEPHPHEPNARRALRSLLAPVGVTAPEQLDDIVALAYAVGRGDPWIGYQAIAADSTGLHDARDPVAVLRHRLSPVRT
jgi:hypothetical protein